ncbi:MAG: phosphotransferase [Bacteroidota bacterium]|nr:phosphotransferase [Bacteroidota bacterium]
MMIEAAITNLLSNIQNDAVERIVKLPQSGSDRVYFRVYTIEKTFIATYNNNVQENKTFIGFTHHFKQKNLPVPQVLAVNDELTLYIQEDAGTESLLDKLSEHGHDDLVYQLFQQSLQQLARLQILGDEGLNYNLCLTAKEFGKQAIMSDLLYFKYYFLDTLKLPYDKQALYAEFENTSEFLVKDDNIYFMFRDFQSRNIIVNENKLCFIDYQGGMRGALQYDVASLLWQAKAELSNEWKNSLLHYYMDEADALLPQKLNRNLFVEQYNGYVLLRLLQVLGAYGFRGLFERKAHFVTSIPLALKNLKSLLDVNYSNEATPEFTRILKAIVSDDIISRFENIQANETTPLLISINSFSYKKGLPKDTSGHGGGFVFDCRGMLNPGRYDQFKCSSGLDKNVQHFLEENTKMNEYLNNVYNLVDISVEDYIKRGFNSLSISFGCTGGQHRSVYAAEQTTRHLKNKYKVKVEAHHLNQNNWVKEVEETMKVQQRNSSTRQHHTTRIPTLES